MQRSKTPDDYFAQLGNWRDEMAVLRKIILRSELKEEIKWGAPCYTYKGKNIIGLGAFKAYFGLWFHQGVLLQDKQNVLMNAQEGKTKALRQWRMTSRAQIDPALIKNYVNEAVQLAKDGKFMPANRQKSVIIPTELKRALAANPDTAKAFKVLRKGLQREYAEYIVDAKREATKQRRLDKILPMILAGQGLNDKYR